MTLYFIGLGLNDERDITIKGLEAIKKCKKIYLESYTSKLDLDKEKLEKFYDKEIIYADRNLVENLAEKTIIKDAKKSDTAFLVVGDVFGATTHTDIFLRARKEGITCRVIHNTSIINAVSDTGLELYKFGKTTSIPFPEESFMPTTAYDVIYSNLRSDLHTLVLLDIKEDKKKYMSVDEGLKILLEIEKIKKKKIISKKTKCIGCARLGSEKQKIIYGELGSLIKQEFGKPLHCIIIPGKLHFIEEEFLELFMV
ncbi:MAG: diphthine synthase [Nanoarchaeota archaeon]